jgi:HK97 family phage major capsid protein
MGKTKSELKAQMRECQGKMADYAGNAEKATEFAQAEREFKAAQAELAVLEEEEREKREQPKKGVGEQMREVLQGQRTGAAEREMTLAVQGKASGAIALTVHDLIPNLEEGNGLPSGLSVVSGVTGNAVYPTDASDMELTELGETAEITPQVVNFDNVTVTPHRVALSCDISNSLIDNVEFDVMGHIRSKFNKAWRKYLAQKTYSQAQYTGNKGGFSGLAKAGDITLGAGSAYGSILKAVAGFVAKGLDAESVCLVMDAETEANLKLEPKQKGVAGYVIENGKCCGYEYVVTSKINTVLGTDAKTANTNTDKTKLYPTTAKYIGVGFFEYLKVQQHGEVRLTFDATSKAVAAKNLTNITLNTEFSFTDLSKHIYDENGAKVSAFALYEVKAGA